MCVVVHEIRNLKFEIFMLLCLFVAKVRRLATGEVWLHLAVAAVGLAASCMLAAACYLHNSSVFCVLAILATVIVIAFNRAFAYTMLAFVIVCHTNTLLSKTMLELRHLMVKQITARFSPQSSVSFRPT